MWTFQNMNRVQNISSGKKLWKLILFNSKENIYFEGKNYIALYTSLVIII